MKKVIRTKLIALALALVMLAGALPGTLIASFAAEAGEETSAALTKEQILAASDAYVAEAANRTGVVKDRSAIPLGAQAAVYVDGELIYSGMFSPAWNKAMEKAPSVSAGYSEEGIAALPTVEFVLNGHIFYDKTWFSEKTMTIAGKKLTIDLNGYVIKRTDTGYSVINVKDHAVVTIMDSRPTITNSSYAHETLIKDLGHPVYSVKGGVIAGGYYSTGSGGGLKIEDNSTVYMLGGTITGNKAAIGSGVHLSGGSTLDMRGGNAQICYNYTAGLSWDGGAVYVGSGCRLYGGNVHHNLADDYAGGVRAEGDNILISEVIIHHNRALEKGGGMYIERNGTEQTITVDQCIITNNYSDEEGGGVYIYDLYLAKMNSCIVQNNAAKSGGGGIFLCDQLGTDLQIGGTMIVRHNFIASFKDMYSDTKSNLYVEGDDDLIVESLGARSEVWLRLESGLNKYNGIDNRFTVHPTDVSPLFFFSDVEGYHVEHQSDPNKENFRHLYFAKGDRQPEVFETLTDYAPAKTETPYKVRNGEYAGKQMDLIRGYFRYEMASTVEFLTVTPFYYSDGYFLEDPKVYNEHLATMSACLEFSAFGVKSDHVSGNPYANSFRNVKQLMADIGCADEEFFVNDDFLIKPTYYGDEDKGATIGVAISYKEITVDGETYILLPVAVRGQGYEEEWGSNVRLGVEGEAEGFADAAKQVYDCVDEYVKDHHLLQYAVEGRIKFWMVGYSRSGAAVNLAAKRVVDDYGKTGNAVFAYTFEAPRGGVESAKLEESYTDGGQYLSIHNVVNENDIVPLVGPEDMGFIRYGVDHLIGADYNGGDGVSYDPNSTYYQQRTLMLAQLKAIQPYYSFYDYWEPADVNPLLSNVPVFGTDLIDKGVQSWDNPNPECENAYLFARWCLNQVLMDGLGVDNMSEAREAYASKKILAEIEGNARSLVDYTNLGYNFGYSDYTVEDSLSALARLVFGLSADAFNELIDILMQNASDYMDSLSISELYDLFVAAIDDWDTKQDMEKSQIVHTVLYNILNGRDARNPVWHVLDPEQRLMLAESLPVVVWFLLEYAAEDYNTGSSESDDGMWGVGTLLNNMGNLLSNHYPEVTHAWLRSYDSHYDYELKAYAIEKTATCAPIAMTTMDIGKVALTAEAGSSIFYSTDGGESWHLYTKPINVTRLKGDILTYSVSYDVKSEVVSISPYMYAGALIGEGDIRAIVVLSAAGIASIVIAVLMIKKKRDFGDDEEGEEELSSEANG